MHLKARLSNLKVSPRKTRLVIDLVRGKSVNEAERILTFVPKISAAPILKLIKSAVANVEHGTELKKEQLFIKSITATPGNTLKRFHPRAHGRAMTIRKRWSNVLLELGEQTTPSTATSAASAERQKKTTSKTKISKASAEISQVKTVTDINEVKKLTAKDALPLHSHSGKEEGKHASAGHNEKQPFKQRKTGGE